MRVTIEHGAAVPAADLPFPQRKLRGRDAENRQTTGTAGVFIFGARHCNRRSFRIGTEPWRTDAREQRPAVATLPRFDIKPSAIHFDHRVRLGGEDATQCESTAIAHVEQLTGLHPVPGGCIHEMGTARMGNDPKTAVLNKFNQCYDAANVFITDGSCMVSTACQNPSLTYMALTARACDHAVKELKRGNL